MAIAVNLVGRKRRETKGKSLVSASFIIFLSAFSIYFLVVSGIVVYKLVTLNRKIAEINEETVRLSEDIRSKNDLVTKYVLVKYILDYYANIQKSKFQYKDYLDQVVSILPRDSVLINMDFGIKGWISLSAKLPNHASLLELEDGVIGSGAFSKTSFDSVFIENVVRDKDGRYTIKMHLSIAKNG